MLTIICIRYSKTIVEEPSTSTDENYFTFEVVNIAKLHTFIDYCLIKLEELAFSEESSDIERRNKFIRYHKIGFNILNPENYKKVFLTPQEVFKDSVRVFRKRRNTCSENKMVGCTVS